MVVGRPTAFGFIRGEHRAADTRHGVVLDDQIIHLMAEIETDLPADRRGAGLVRERLAYPGPPPPGDMEAGHAVAVAPAPPPPPSAPPPPTRALLPITPGPARPSLRARPRQVERSTAPETAVHRGAPHGDPAERPERLPAQAGRVLLVDDRDALALPPEFIASDQPGQAPTDNDDI